MAAKVSPRRRAGGQRALGVRRAAGGGGLGGEGAAAGGGRLPAVTSGPSLAKLKGGRRLLRAAADRRPRGRGAAGQRAARRAAGTAARPALGEVPASRLRVERLRGGDFSTCGARACSLLGTHHVPDTARPASGGLPGPARPGPTERCRAQLFAGSRIRGCSGGEATAGPRRGGRR